MQDQSQFQRGDTVRLKSGGPKMSVVSAGPRIEVVYFGPDGLQGAEFPACVLTHERHQHGGKASKDRRHEARAATNGEMTADPDPAAPIAVEPDPPIS